MDMTRRKFSREFKIEAVKPLTDRGSAVAQAARDLDLAESVLRRLCCTNPLKDSSREISVVAGFHKQTHTHDLQDQALARP